jgi:membrane fusion protein, multidrug efflux system
VAGTAKGKPVAQIALPWSALMAWGLRPAVWTVDPLTRAALLKRVTIGGYEANAVLVNGGLQPGERRG